MLAFRVPTELLSHDPWPVVAFGFFGAACFQFGTMLLRLQKYRPDAVKSIEQWRIPFVYLNEARDRGWSAWTAHCFWIFLSVGISLLLLGFFRLPD
jgi:hypothetical protein